MKRHRPNIFIKILALWLFCLSAVYGSTVVPKDSTDQIDVPSDTIAEASPLDSSFRVHVDHSFTWAAFLLTHQSLKNSKSLHNWPAFGLVSPIAWNSSLLLEKDFGKLITLKGLVGSNISFMDVGINANTTLEIIHLLELGLAANIHSSINYGDYATFMGVYDVEQKDFDTDMFMTEFAYGINYHIGATIPLIAFLPKNNWTKIILRPNVNWTYTAYTGAEDGDIWKCGAEYSANGLRYRYGGTLIYILPFERFPMLMVNVNASGYFKSTNFNKDYANYDPYFKTIGITPMLSTKISDKWNGMIMANFSRDRKYKNYRYETAEELLQKRTGSEWTMKVIMMTFTRKF